jgi:hypothetical protein
MTATEFHPCPDCLIARDDQEPCSVCPVTIALREGTNKRADILPPNQDELPVEPRTETEGGTFVPWEEFERAAKRDSTVTTEPEQVTPPTYEPRVISSPLDSLRIDLARIADALEYQNKPLRALEDYFGWIGRQAKASAVGVVKLVQDLFAV